jgi:hypothetical protein
LKNEDYFHILPLYFYVGWIFFNLIDFIKKIKIPIKNRILHLKPRLSRIQTFGGCKRIGRPGPPTNVWRMACYPALPLAVGMAVCHADRQGEWPSVGGQPLWMRQRPNLSGRRSLDVIFSKNVQNDNLA